MKWILLTIVLLISACGGLGGEPEIAITRPPLLPAGTPNTVADLGYPSTTPDLQRGAALYQQHCTACHGPDGRGDGELVLSGQVMNPGNFRDPESATGQSPKAWFDTITNGRIEQLMPPWNNALSETERWDVALYTYTLHYTADTLALGERLYTEECAACHGDQGRGDGPEADSAQPPHDLTNQSTQVRVSDRVYFNVIREGSTRGMPAYDDYTDEQVWALASYARALSVANLQPTVAQAQVTDEPTAETSSSEVIGTISGQVTHGTAGATLPDGLQVIMRVFTQSGQPLDEFTQLQTIGVDGQYRFENVLITSDRFYLTAVDYLERGFASGAFVGTPDAPDMVLPIVLYELTDDPSVITVNASVSQIEVVGDTIETQLSMRFVNTSDRVFTALTPEADGRFRTLTLPLPIGAVVVGAPDRYLVDPQTFTVYDTRPLSPGEETFMQVVYLLQYGGGALIDYRLPYTLDGQLRVLVQPNTIRVDSPLLPAQGEETLGDQVYQGYGQRVTLAPASVIQYTLTGEAAPVAAVETPGVVASSALIPVVIVGIIALAVVGGVGVYLMQRNRRDPQVLIDGLIRQIAELDAQHDAGQVNHDVYQQRRSQLKARLAELMDGQDKK
ncbi:MAG: c-type cytochrome [Anaerolineae bacterium]|jgi:mono/diheme cytochrome c family protein|nr:c-type cytochrome [Anaerolineae bacterium]